MGPTSEWACMALRAADSDQQIQNMKRFLVPRFLRALERFKFRNVAKNPKNVVNEGANAKISLRCQKV